MGRVHAAPDAVLRFLSDHRTGNHQNEGRGVAWNALFQEQASESLEGPSRNEDGTMLTARTSVHG
jgi:hypothetical protein